LHFDVDGVRWLLSCVSGVHKQGDCVSVLADLRVILVEVGTDLEDVLPTILSIIKSNGAGTFGQTRRKRGSALRDADSNRRDCIFSGNYPARIIAMDKRTRVALIELMGGQRDGERLLHVPFDASGMLPNSYRLV
jgi:hypothetical protein